LPWAWHTLSCYGTFTASCSFELTCDGSWSHPCATKARHSKPLSSSASRPPSLQSSASSRSAWWGSSRQVITTLYWSSIDPPPSPADPPAARVASARSFSTSASENARSSAEIPSGAELLELLRQLGGVPLRQLGGPVVADGIRPGLGAAELRPHDVDRLPAHGLGRGERAVAGDDHPVAVHHDRLLLAEPPQRTLDRLQVSLRCRRALRPSSLSDDIATVSTSSGLFFGVFFVMKKPASFGDRAGPCRPATLAGYRRRCDASSSGTS